LGLIAEGQTAPKMHASIMLPTTLEVNWKVPFGVLHLCILSRLLEGHARRKRRITQGLLQGEFIQYFTAEKFCLHIRHRSDREASVMTPHQSDFKAWT